MGIIDGSYVKAHLPDAKAIVADKGYDNECIREQITKKGVRAVIPRKRNSLKGNADMDIDTGIWWRCFCLTKAISGSGDTIQQAEEKF